MSCDDRRDPLLNALASLPAVEMGPAATDMLRDRCRAALAGQGNQPFALPLEPAAAGLASAYAWQLVKLAMLLSR